MSIISCMSLILSSSWYASFSSNIDSSYHTHYSSSLVSDLFNRLQWMATMETVNSQKLLNIFMPLLATSCKSHSVFGLPISACVIIYYWSVKIVRYLANHLREFHLIHNSDAAGDKDKLIKSWGQKFKGQHQDKTTYGQKRHFANSEGHAFVQTSQSQTTVLVTAFQSTVHHWGSSTS